MAQVMSAADYTNIPAGAPPLGVVSDFDNPSSRAYEAHVYTGICIGTMTVFLVLRLYVKAAITHIWGLEDYTCIIGYVLILIHDVLFFILMRRNRGLGMHIWDVRLANVTKTLLATTDATVSLYPAAICFIKFSLFFLYLRLFKPNKVTRWLIYVGVAVCAMFYTASIIAVNVLCVPRPSQPNPTATWLSRQEQCSRPTKQVAIVQAVFGTITDIYLLVVPIRIVFRLQLPLGRKIGISAVFMVGIIAVVCSLASLAYRAELLSVEDQTWFSVSVYILNAAETSAGIMCSCLPLLTPLVRGHSFKNLFLFQTLAHYFSTKFSALRSSQKPVVAEDTSSQRQLHPGMNGNRSANVSNEGWTEGSEWIKLDDRAGEGKGYLRELY